MAHVIGATKVSRNTKLRTACRQQGRPDKLLPTPRKSFDAKVAMLALTQFRPYNTRRWVEGYDSIALRL